MKRKILVIGGTMFAGRLLVEKLCNDNRYDTTLFNRGKTNTNLFPNLSKFHGNRETDDLSQICNQNWDVVVDFCGYYPVTFHNLLNKLSNKVGRYIFISTLSVFPFNNNDKALISENDPTLNCSDEQKISILPDAYGEKKAEMERILLSHPELDPIILRPSFIYGRYDWTDRFYYWIFRAYINKTVLLPPTDVLSLTYVDDLVKGLLNAIEVKEHSKCYNAVSHRQITLNQILKTSAELLNKDISIININEDFLQKNDVNQSSFPLAIPFALDAEGEKWFNDLNVIPTAFNETIEETIKYAKSLNWPEPKTGLTLSKEIELIKLNV
jgi:2'-hydroxyisoflavone reductase